MDDKLAKRSEQLQLQTGPYCTTFVGTKILRTSTKEEWLNYGEILYRVDEAKQWAIGDWLLDGMNHFEEHGGNKYDKKGTGLYQEAEKILKLGYQYLADQKNLAELFSLKNRFLRLTYVHHKTVSSIKQTEEVLDKDKEPTGKLKRSDEPDIDKMQELLSKADKRDLSTGELKELVTTYKRQQDEIIRLANSPEKYSLFYADPPWQYGDKLVEGYGAAEHHYPTMSINELCDLPIKNITADNAVLFLWVTSPLLAECFDVIDAWGFEYKASFVWNKGRHNYGHYNSVRHEFLLICTKGSYLPEISKLPNSVVSVKRSETHSEKPKEFRELIEEMYPESKKIELFARGKYEGWDVWGDEV